MSVDNEKEMSDDLNHLRKEERWIPIVNRALSEINSSLFRVKQERLWAYKSLQNTHADFKNHDVSLAWSFVGIDTARNL